MEMVIVFKAEMVAVCMNSELIENTFEERRNWSMKETRTSFIGIFAFYFGL